MDVAEFLSNPGHREAVRALVERVLKEIEPVEAEVALEYVDPLLDLAAKDEVVVVDLWNEPGRFGNADLLVRLIVPLIAKTMARSAGGGAAAVTRGEVKSMIVRVRSSRGRRRLDDLERVINAALTEDVSRGESRRAG
jgi:hypothetical protein